MPTARLPRRRATRALRCCAPTMPAPAASTPSRRVAGWCRIWSTCSNDLGNLESRQDNLQGLWESFQYDQLNRVNSITTQAGSGSLSKTIGYDGVGNITGKSGVGAYTYNAGRPHVLATAGGQAYTHDANGNMLSGAGRTFSWNRANLPSQISQPGKVLNFSYGPDRSRFKQVTVINGATETTTYIGGLYEKIIKGSLTTQRHSIQANGSTVALYTLRSSGVNEVHYLFGDHLGSVDTITNRAGQLVEKLSYDAWGKRRPQNWDDSASQLTSTVQDRGFTGHEHLDDVSLIHMNGRVYYPSLGRFISADPTVQFPKYSQSLNRYSYVVNNPLSYTDPSGFGFFSELLDFSHKIDPIQRNLDNILAKSTTLQQIGGVAAGVASVVWGQPWIAGVYAAHITNLKGGSTTDIVKAGAIAAGAAYAGGKLEGLKYTSDKIAAGIFIAGTAGVASGGDVGTSFAVAAFTGAAAYGAAQLHVHPVIGTIITATIGGTASQISGGKFANGATTGAFQYLLVRSLESPDIGRQDREVAIPGDIKRAVQAAVGADLRQLSLIH